MQMFEGELILCRSHHDFMNSVVYVVIC